MMTDALDPGLAGYLTANRDFVDAAVGQAVAALELPAGGRVLDMVPTGSKLTTARWMHLVLVNGRVAGICEGRRCGG